jgi:hypothetical protein
MKRFLSEFVIVFLLAHSIITHGQSFGSREPFKVPSSPTNPIFGKDIVISDQPVQPQQSIALCSALNGWLFSAYTYHNDSLNTISLRIMKSTDNGISWNQFFDGWLDNGSVIVPKIELMACGYTENDIKLFIGILYYDTIYQYNWASLSRINGNTGILEGELMHIIGGIIRDFSIANDNLFPSVNSNPYSIAVIYSRINNGDSIVIRTSSNGGASLNGWKVAAVEPYSSQNTFNRVSISYGRTPGANTGRYFAAWEKIDKNNQLKVGHIYCAHSEPYFNSSFTVPVCLDSINPSLINQLRRPVISCQYSSSDNMNGNISELIMCEKYISSTNCKIEGFYNLQASTSNSFQQFTLTSASGSIMQPDVAYNPYTSSFMMTYFDSTELRLPFKTKDVNLSTPGSWNTISTGYNDETIIATPSPKVRINYSAQDGIDVWENQGMNGYAVALFDAPYSTYTSIDNLFKNDYDILSVYPSPCDSKATICFTFKSRTHAKLLLCENTGKIIKVILDNDFTPGAYQVLYNFSDHSPGIYYVCIWTDKGIDFKKIIHL